MKSLRNIVIRVWVVLILILNTLPVCLAAEHQKPYIFPYYPEFCRRLWLEGPLMVKLDLERGQVLRVDVVDHRLRSPQGPWKDSEPMSRSIESALRLWTFEDLDLKEHRVIVLFQLVGETKDNNPKYSFHITRYPSGLPRQIVVQAQPPGPDDW